MEWFAYIDAYCERTAPGFWNEPLNALSNGAFLLAAAVATVHVQGRETARDDRPLKALVLLVAVVGIGSFLFHTFARFWSLLADVVPINIFICGYLAFVLRRFFSAAPLVTVLGVAGFLGLSIGLDSAVPAHVLNGSVGYLPSLFALLAIAGVLHLREHPAARDIAIAAVIMGISLTFRSLDNAVCSAWPFGTHFVWHLMNALLLYWLLRAAVSHGTPRAS